jgi:hypothetical protein
MQAPGSCHEAFLESIRTCDPHDLEKMRTEFTPRPGWLLRCRYMPNIYVQLGGSFKTLPALWAMKRPLTISSAAAGLKIITK